MMGRLLDWVASAAYRLDQAAQRHHARKALAHNAAHRPKP